MAEYTDSTDDKTILADARKGLRECIDEEDNERSKMADDLRFAALDQWPEEIKNDRMNDQENGPRPCLVIDKVNQFIVQVVNDVRQGRPGINVRPQDDAADIKTAKILKGLIRNIEDQSKADIAYATAVELAAKIGLAYIRVTTEYVDEEVSKDQDIFIRPVPNTFSVYLGKHIMPDGSDAEKGYIVEKIPLERFQAEYPKAKSKPDEFEELQAEDFAYWHTGEDVTVVEEYCLYRSRLEIVDLSDGTSMSQADYDKWPDEAGPKLPVTATRSMMKKQLKWRKMTGVQVLDKRDLPGRYIPIIEVVGRETWVDGKRVLWGLVRPAKDSLRMYNYWSSFLTEKFGLAGKTPYIGAVGQFEGLEARWREANKKNFAYLEYKPIDVNGNALPAPQRQGPTPMEAAYFHQMQVIEHDVQTSLGMFKAATGESESQQSGRAILALQKESDTGTYHFGANLGVSIRQVGVVILDMIPHYYDTKRIVRIIGEDGEVQTAQLDPDSPVAHQPGQGGMMDIYNPSIGKYDISISAGPSYNTQRMEAQATFVEMAKGAADPASAAIMRYLVVRNSDSAGSEEAAKLLKTMLPPQALQAMASNEPVPPQAMAQIQQLTQKTQAADAAIQELSQENQELKAGVQVQAMKVQGDQEAARADFALQKEKQDREAQLAREKADAELALKKHIAVAEVEIDEIKMNGEANREERRLAFDMECRAKDEAAKTAEQNEKQSESAMPKMMDAMAKIVAEFAKAMESTAKTNAAIVEAINNPKPKTIRIGAIQHNGSGAVTGGTATVQ